MITKKLLDGLNIKNIIGDLPIEIDNVVINANNKTENSCYICLVGINADGHNFAQQAVLNGAKLVICEKKLEGDFCQVVVEDSRIAYSIIASNFFENPSSKLKIIGITGTNGKTTSSYICKHILEVLGKKVGLIGTEGVWIGSEKLSCELTTPDPMELHNFFRLMVSQDCEYCFMEVSAHAIALKKIYGVKFEIGLMTNITQDHLDFFKTMENYSKVKIDFLTSDNVKYVIANSDDKSIHSINKKCSTRICSYGRENPSDIFSTNEEVSGTGMEFFVNAFDDISEVKTLLMGNFNISNLLGCIGVCLKLGFPLMQIASTIESLKPVGGRFNVIKLGKNRQVVIDFAHTPDGIEQILKSSAKFCVKPIICLFGCGGNRDRGKRAKMAEIAEQNSHFVIVTSDNPRFEKPEFIMFEISKGFKKTNHIFSADRRVAVSLGLEYLSSGGTLVLCGKGDEKYQDINGIKSPYSDFDEVKKFIDLENLKNYNNTEAVN